MNYNEKGKFGKFPDPFANQTVKASKPYGLKYAKAIEKQWGRESDAQSLYKKRKEEFETNRDYANGTQDTAIYKQILNSLNPDNGDGSLLNLDWSPVPIVPKFVKIVVNKILSLKPYPNVGAIDPLSQSEKEQKRAEKMYQVKNKEVIRQMQELGVKTNVDLSEVPETTEEAEIFMDTNIKTAAEIAAQVGTNMTLEWNEFDQRVYRRAVNDLVVTGMAVVKRNNDPNHGITEEYVDPAYFLHSFTEDPTFSDITYGGHVKEMTIQELKRLAGDELTERDFEKIAQKVKNLYGNNASSLGGKFYNEKTSTYHFGYDDYKIEVLSFEFKAVDDMMFEEKRSKHGNKNFYYKGYEYNAPKRSVYERKPSSMSLTNVYGGQYILGTECIFDYGMKTNIPRNIHDLSKATLSYSVTATNLRRMMPKSFVGSILGFADQLQLSHLKLQQAIAKAKPDGIIIDVEALEDVQLGKGGELQPLELHDIYEQTGVMYYRGKSADGNFQNPPIRTIDNSIRNINELIAIYNHNLRLIRDTTGVNEAMDGTSPKGEQLVGVRQQAISGGNNAIYDITNAAIFLYARVCADVIRCLQILPKGSILFKAYERAIGKTNMKVLSSFSNLPMYNFGVKIQTELDETEKAYLEQNIQIALAQKEIDLEDAIAVRQLKDIDQAERLLIIRRKKRMRMQQEIAQQNSQMQAQITQQASAASSQARMQEIQAEAQAKIMAIQAEAQAKAQLMQMEYQLKGQIEGIKIQTNAAMKQADQSFRMQVEDKREDAKDARVKKQAVEQSKLISQRQGQRGELKDEGQNPYLSL